MADEAKDLVDQLIEARARLYGGAGNGKLTIMPLTDGQRGRFSEAWSQAMRGNGSEIKFFGMDIGKEPSIGVECVWNGEVTRVVRVTKPKPRREPFPNPEPMAYRPKAW